MTNTTQDESSFQPDSKLGDGHFTIRISGWAAQIGKIDIGPQRCGHIRDGISFDLATCEEPNTTQWHPGGVISFADLEAIYFAAKAARGLK